MRFNSITLILSVCGLGFVGCAGSTPESELLGLPPLPSHTAAFVSTSADPVTDFAEAAARALAADPGLSAARHRLLAADAERVQAATWTNPTLRAEAEGWGIDRDGFDQSELTLTAAFPLDLVGKRGARVSVAEAETNVERSRYNEARRVVVASVRSAVLSVRAETERERLAVERLGITEQTANALAREVEVGKVPPLEQVRAEVDRESARAELVRTRASMRAARLRLGGLLGHPGTEIDATGTLREASIIPDSVLLAKELILHPRRVGALWSAESARRRERQVGREKWPEMEAEVGLRRYMDADANAWVTGLSVGLPLWDHKAGRARAARELAEAANQDVDAVDRDLRLEFTGLLTELEASQTRLDLYRNQILPQAEDALALARKGFDGGKFGYLDLLEAQSSLLNVKREYLEARISYEEVVGGLESLLGREPQTGLLPESP